MYSSYLLPKLKSPIETKWMSWIQKKGFAAVFTSLLVSEIDRGESCLVPCRRVDCRTVRNIWNSAYSVLLPNIRLFEYWISVAEYFGYWDEYFVTDRQLWWRTRRLASDVHVETSVTCLSSEENLFCYFACFASKSLNINKKNVIADHRIFGEEIPKK